MYGISELYRGLEEPRFVIAELNRLFTHKTNGVSFNPDGVDIFDEDWDNLVLLDACRYDTFENVADLPGELDYRTSRGSTSTEFIRGNFTDKTLHDVVYVSANRFYAKMRDDIDSDVHDFVPVELDAPDVASSMPSTVTDRALETAEQYPNKRLIVHYLQPHQPYLSPESQHLENGSHIYDTIAKNEMSKSEIVEAYRDNLRFVLDEVERLLATLQGKTVISADHGELFGERQRPIPMRDYGHPEGVYVEELVKVPWHTSSNGPRKNIVSEQPSKKTDVTGEVDEQLRNLGYRI